MDNIGMGLGLGEGAGIIGSPAWTFDPTTLSSLVHYWNAEEENVTVSGTPALVDDFAQLAASGSGTTPASVNDKAFYFDADYVLDSVAVGPSTITRPNGHNFWGSSVGIDSARNSTDMKQTIDTPYTYTVGMSCVLSFFMHSDFGPGSNRRMMTGSGRQYFEFDAHGNVKVYDTGYGPNYLIRDGHSSLAWADEWHILAWTFGAGTFSIAMDGVEYAPEVSVAGMSGNSYLSQVPSGATYCTFLTHYMVWDEAHTLADLHKVAQPLSTLLGTTYSYTPV